MSDECPIDADHLWRASNTELDPSGEILYDIVSLKSCCLSDRYACAHLHSVNNLKVPYSNIVFIARHILGEQIGASIHLPPDTPNPINETDPRSTSITFTPAQYNVAYFSKDQVMLEDTGGSKD